MTDESKPAAEGEASASEASESSDQEHRARRIGARFQTDFVGKQVEGTGTVRNISLTGALIEDCSPLLIGGGDVRLTFSFFEGSLPVEVRAKTVRETKTGFAVQFVGMHPRVKAILSAAIGRAEGEEAQTKDAHRATARNQPLFTKKS